MSVEPVDVVWCDFGGVLTPPLGEAVDSITRASGIGWEDLQDAIRRVAEPLGLTGLQPLELGLLSQAEWGACVMRCLAPGVRPAVDLGQWGDYWYRDRPVNRPLLLELERIRAAGVRVGMLTNSVLEWEPHRAAMLGGVGTFVAYVRSHEIGIAKPDPRIFDYADTILPTNSGRAVLIDDMSTNCSAAAAHGWTPVHHRHNAETIGHLRNLIPDVGASQ